MFSLNIDFHIKLLHDCFLDFLFNNLPRFINRFRYSWNSRLLLFLLLWFSRYSILELCSSRFFWWEPISPSASSSLVATVSRFSRFFWVNSRLFFKFSYRLQLIVNTSRHRRNHWMEKWLEHRFLDRKHLFKQDMYSSSPSASCKLDGLFTFSASPEPLETAFFAFALVIMKIILLV